MSHAPQPPRRWTPDHQQTTPASPAQPQAEAGARGPDRVLYGPRGEVIARYSDRPFLGLHQHYTSQNQPPQGDPNN